jgi:hypothetical protein
MAEDKGQQSKLVNDGKVIAAKPGPVYGDCEISRPDSMTVYDNRGGKSCTALTVSVPVIAAGLTLACSVYARISNGKVSFQAALPKGVKAADESRDAFKAHVAEAVNTWPGRVRAFREAYIALTTTKVAKADGTKPTEIEVPDGIMGEAEAKPAGTTK